MPFRKYTDFDSETLDRMGEAYDAVVRQLDIKSGTPLTGTLAAWIAALAKEGERDVKVLTQRAIAALRETRTAKKFAP